MPNGSIEVSDIRPSNKQVVRVKDTPTEKSYRIKAQIETITESNSIP